MNLDDFTYQDLSVFSNMDEYSIFHKLDFTSTLGGRECLNHNFKNPLRSIDDIVQAQKAIALFLEKRDHFPSRITNGTILVMEKFLDYQMDPMPMQGDRINSYVFRFLHAADFSMAKFSLVQFHEFVCGISELCKIIEQKSIPQNVGKYLQRIKKLINRKEIHQFTEISKDHSFSIYETVQFARFFHVEYRKQIIELISIFFQFDAWHSMAKAMDTFHLEFPEFLESDSPFFETTGLYHLLLPEAISYDISINQRSNFIFLTGANMAGKSTFIKAVGLSCFLAHIGMGVPAKHLRLSLFEGILTNINVTDNIIKGESYFFNEVRRIKDTINRINDGKKWMVLIDELFKGTNVQDAMKCSLAVIEGLIKIKNGLFVLSTHLYEIAENLEKFPNISFKFFETIIDENQLQFKYQLKNGVSNDRIGYLILKKEGIVDLLDSL